MPAKKVSTPVAPKVPAKKAAPATPSKPAKPPAKEEVKNKRGKGRPTPDQHLT